MGSEQPAAVARATTSMQTLSQAEQDLSLAQQGRLPLPKADLKLCRVITGVLQRATEQARQGYITEAERKVCMVSLPFCSPALAIQYTGIVSLFCVPYRRCQSCCIPSSASLVGLPSKHVVASLPSFSFLSVSFEPHVLRHIFFFKECDISLAHFLGFQSLTCLSSVILCWTPMCH